MFHFLSRVVPARHCAFVGKPNDGKGFSPSRNKCLLVSIVLRSLSGYKGDGKTTISILNQDAPDILLIDSYSSVGFRLNTGLFIVGPMAIFPKSLLQWDVGSVAEVTVDSLSLFFTLEPKLDLLIIGAAEGGEVAKTVVDFMKSKRVDIEVLPTYQACSTYNFLVAEDRYVAGAMIPPRILPVSEEDIIRSKAQQRQKMYEVEDDMFFPSKK